MAHSYHQDILIVQFLEHHLVYGMSVVANFHVHLCFLLLQQLIYFVDFYFILVTETR